jgi:hypothetical protein
VTAEEIIEGLGLEAHPSEGGYFRETYRSSIRLRPEGELAAFGGLRSLSTAIYYLLTPDTCSLLHRLKADEVWHFYLGDPVQMLTLGERGGEVVTLGSGVSEGMAVQAVVPAGFWQGARLKPGGRFALMGTTLAPGFEFEDFEAGRREVLIPAYPAFEEEIEALTRPGGDP